MRKLKLLTLILLLGTTATVAAPQSESPLGDGAPAGGTTAAATSAAAQPSDAVAPPAAAAAGWR